MTGSAQDRPISPAPSRPLALYVHLPWCLRKCPYCDFNSHELRDSLPEKAYLDALRADLAEELETVSDRTVDTVFFGGGTPSLFSPEAFDAIIGDLCRHGRLSEGAEVTLEANPGAVDSGRFAGYRAAGVNRLSIGVQSFNNRMLRQLGRIHDARQSRGAVETARRAGFDNLNIDLMFGLPGQTVADASADVEAALHLEPEHLSYYQLTLEPNTLFHARPPRLPDELDIEHMHETGLARLRESGLYRYEVSAFARHQRRCRHNLNYWQFGDYLGVGAGAHGKIADGDGVLRYSKPRNPKDYQATREDFRQHRRTVGGDDLRFEFLLGALRLVDGFPLDRYVETTGLDADMLLSRLEPFLEQRLLHFNGQRIRATDRGYRYLDELLQQFLPDQ